MLLENSLKLAISPEQLMPLLQDLERIAPCLPGATITERVGENGYRGRVTIKVGPVTVKYEGLMTITEIDPEAGRLVMKGEGRDSQGGGNASATITMTVTAGPDGGSVGTIHSDVAVTGRIAQFGRGLMQDVGDRLLTQFAQCLEQSFGSAAAAPAETGAPGAEGPPAPRPVAIQAKPVGMFGLLLRVLWRRIRHPRGN